MSPPPGRPSWRRQDGRLTMSHGLVGFQGISPGNGFEATRIHRYVQVLFTLLRVL